MPVVHPVVHEGFGNGLGSIQSTFALSNLILMMRKLQISTSPMYIKMLSQELARHGRALNMPTGSTFAPRRCPARITRLIGFSGFPEDKV